MRTPSKNYDSRPERNCVKCGVLFSGYRCGACQSARKKNYTEKNRERINAYNNQWRKDNPEKMKTWVNDWAKRNPEKVKISQKKSALKRRDKRLIECREWRKLNQEHIKQKWVEWRTANAEHLSQYRKEYAEKNPEIVRARKHSRRIKENVLFSKIDSEYVKFLTVVQGMVCPYCNADMEEKGYQIDHVVPIARGGDNSNHNLQLLCPSCNRKKGSKTDTEYRMYLNAICK